MDFNKEVSKLAAILGISPSKMKDLTTQARKLGEGTRYTARQVIQLQTELAKLGFNRGQILGMSSSVLKFAQAVGTDLADAAKTTGSVMRIFDLSVHDTEQTLNMLAKATTSSALTFDYISTALPIAGQAAKQSGFQMQDLIAILGTLANSGMSASMAATATRNIFLKMADANGVLVKTLGKQPKTLKELIEGMRELKDRGVNLNDVLQMTGVRASVAFASLLDGTDSIEELKKKIEESTGAIEQMRKTMDDNLEGAIKRLNSAWEEFAITIQGSQGTLQSIVDMLAGGLNTYTHKYFESEEQSIERQADTEREAMINSQSDDSFWNANYKRYKEVYENAIKDAIADNMKSSEAQQFAYSKVSQLVNADREELQKDLEKSRKDLHDTYINYEDDFNDLSLFQKLSRDWLLTGKSNMQIDDLIKDETIESIKEDLTSIRTARDVVSINKAKLQVQDMFLDALSKEFKLDEDSSGVGAGKHKGEFVDTITEKLRAENKQLELQNKLLDEGAEKRRDNIETSFAQQINEEEKALLRLSKLIVKANKMDDKQTLEYEGTVYTKADAIRIGYEAMEIRRQNIQKLNQLSIKELGKNQLKEKVITLKYSKQLLNAQLENVREYSEEYYEIKKQMLVMDNAIALEEAHERFVSEMYVTEEQEKELAETLKDLRKKGYTEEEVKQYEHLERMQYNFENYTKEVELINKKHSKQTADISYQERKQQFTNEDNLRKSRRKNGFTPDYQAYYNARMEVDDNEINLDRLLNGKGINPNWSPEEVAKQIHDAEQALYESRVKMRESFIAWNTEEQAYRVSIANKEEDKLLKTIQLKKDELAAYEEINKLKGESDAAYNVQHARMIDAIKLAEKDLADFRYNLAVSTAESIAGTFSTISSAIEECGRENEENVRRSKILALASVYIQEGVAIANAIRTASQSSITVWDMMAKIATAVSTVVVSTAQALKSIKQAKFAKGGVDIQGPGTETSDSIPAMISKGESVMTARATKMFKPLLLAMNDIAAQPNVTLPTSYSGYNAAQVAATKEQLTDSFRDSVKDIHPRVSVVEFHDVDDRYNIVKSLDNV